MPEGATNAAEETKDPIAEIVINLGCTKKIKGLRMKNIKKEEGGTKDFTVYVSDSPEGPWNLILTDGFQEQDKQGCAHIETFDNLE